MEFPNRSPEKTFRSLTMETNVKILLLSLLLATSPAFSNPEVSAEKGAAESSKIVVTATGANASEFSVLLAQNDCCKICRKGKACGDSCIARERVCHVGPGCACDAE